MSVMNKLPVIALSLAAAVVPPACSQGQAKNATEARSARTEERPARMEERPAKEDKPPISLPSSLPSKEGKWEEPAEPFKIAGSLYFIGTRGLGVFLFATSEGHILLNTGMPSSGPMIVESIWKLGLMPEDIKLMINGHAHIDHAGAFAWLKEQLGAPLAIMKEDVAAMESGDIDDFRYGGDLAYPPVKVDRILHDGDTVRMGDVSLTAYHTPGHTRGATTWVANIVEGDKAWVVAFPDSAGVNP